ncbi:MAG: hypothetical protein ABII26_02515 [Pseudomonadota bacterium]
MVLSKEKQEIRDSILGYEKRIDEMHLAFQKYQAGEENIIPEWEKLEREMLVFSRRKIVDFELSKQLDRVMYKFQNRKKIWLKWVEEVHLAGEY